MKYFTKFLPDGEVSGKIYCAACAKEYDKDLSIDIVETVPKTQEACADCGLTRDDYEAVERQLNDPEIQPLQ